jgi:hypothetical protein
MCSTTATDCAAAVLHADTMERCIALHSPTCHTGHSCYMVHLTCHTLL